MEKQMKIEEIFNNLEQIIKEMESGELPLENTFEKYNEGMNLIKQCNNSITKIEQQLTIIEENVED